MYCGASMFFIPDLLNITQANRIKCYPFCIMSFNRTCYGIECQIDVKDFSAVDTIGLAIYSDLKSALWLRIF